MPRSPRRQARRAARDPADASHHAERVDGEERFDAVALNNVDIYGATFIGLRLSGSCAANENAGNIACLGCELNSVVNITGVFKDCWFRGNSTMPTGAYDFQQLQLINCREGAIFALPAQLSLGGASPTNSQIAISGWRGQLTLSNLVNNTTDMRATFDGADLTFDASCTSTISPKIYGDVKVTNAGAVTPDLTARTPEVVDAELSAIHGAGSWLT